MKALGQVQKSGRGFTMVEVLAAIMVLGVMSVSVMSMYSFGKRTNGLVEERLVLTNLFEYLTEEIKARPFSVDVTDSGIIMPPYAEYPFQVAQQIPYQSNPYLKRIDVSCTYNSVLGVSKTLSMNFLVADTS